MGALEAPARPDLNRFDFAPGLDFSCCSATWRRCAERRPTGAEQGRGSLCGFPWKVRFLLLLGGALACWRLSVHAEVTRGRAGVCSSVDFPGVIGFLPLRASHLLGPVWCVKRMRRGAELVCVALWTSPSRWIYPVA